MLRDMRSFLRLLEDKGDLVHITEPTSLAFGVAAGMRKSGDIQGPALLFDNVECSSMRVAGAVYATRRRLIWGLETTASEINGKITHGLRNHIPPRIVSDGPCKEVILKGDNADFGQLPICTHNRKDAGAFITMGLQIARHPEFGNNVSIARMQIFGDKISGIRTVPPQQLATYFLDFEKRGQPLEVAVALGCDPYSTMCSQIPGSIYLDEFGVAGGWMGEPVELVRCETIDVAVPASSEIVLEGEMVPGERRLEGPFGEFPGYYHGTAMQPVFRLKAITHRRDAIYLAGLTGPPTTDNHIMRQVPLEALLFERIRQICPTVRDVYVTDGGVTLHVAVSIRPTFATQARDVMMAAFTTERIRVKQVIVVDDDIDVRDPLQVEWALATRMQADRDVAILPRMVGAALDPSTPAPRVGSVMGIDATRPYGQEFPDVAEVPGADEFVIPGWTDTERP